MKKLFVNLNHLQKDFLLHIKTEYDILLPVVARLEKKYFNKGDLDEIDKIDAFEAGFQDNISAPGGYGGEP